MIVLKSFSNLGYMLCTKVSAIKYQTKVYGFRFFRMITPYYLPPPKYAVCQNFPITFFLSSLKSYYFHLAVLNLINDIKLIKWLSTFYSTSPYYSINFAYQ